MTALANGHGHHNDHTSHHDHNGALHRIADKLKHPFTSRSALAEREKEKEKHDASNGGPSSGESLQKRAKEAEKADKLQREQEELVRGRQEADEAARREETEDEQSRWGQGEIEGEEVFTLDDIAAWSGGDPGSGNVNGGNHSAHPNGADGGKRVTIRGRIEHQRKVSSDLIFLLIRDTTHTIQCVLRAGNDNGVPEHMITWAGRVSVESLVEISGTIHLPPTPIKSASIQQLEIEIHTLHTLAPAQYVHYNNYRPPDQMRQRLNHRLLDLRHPANHALFRIRAAVVKVWRDELDKRDFLEIHTPKIQPAATESGAEVFKMNYFGRNAFLAQSPQLAKQMAISADMKKVYEIGPVFRAENSNTHRHLAEYTGLDMELELQQTYTELIDILVSILRAIIQHVQKMPELSVVRERFPSDDFLLPDQVPVIPFWEGLQMLRDDGREVAEEDLSTQDEIRLGELVREKFQTDLYVLDKFPSNARPFYTHPAADDPKWTNSFDMFFRGQEICTGGQRITDPTTLRQKMKEAGVMDGMDEYLEAFDNGAPPHGGAGLGLERIIFLLLNLGDVRYATLFHRDPKSLPEKPPALPHPEADTMRPKPRRGDEQDPPRLEALIHNYGDSSNTSWLDEGWTIWRQDRTGAAIAYKPKKDRLAMMIGDPLCDPQQYPEVLDDFLAELSRIKLKPIFMLCNEQVQNVLASQHGMRSFTCAEEQRLDMASADAGTGKEGEHLARKIDREGIRVEEVTLDDEFIDRANKAIDAWKENRSSSGTQMHMTEIRPFEDREHRRYFAATGGDSEHEHGDGANSKLHALVVLAQLSPSKGHQVKWALDFPGAANGAIEATVGKALQGIDGPVTFGAAASRSLQPGAQMHGLRAKGLSHTYASIARTMGLGNKSEFREKFGTRAEKVYICYEKNRISPLDLKEIVKFFQD